MTSFCPRRAANPKETKEGLSEWKFTHPSRTLKEIWGPEDLTSQPIGHKPIPLDGFAEMKKRVLGREQVQRHWKPTKKKRALAPFTPSHFPRARENRTCDLSLLGVPCHLVAICWTASKI